MTVKFIASKEVPALIKDGAVIAVEGFIGTGVAEEIHEEMGKSFIENGHPKNLTLLYAAGIGDGGERGLNHYANHGQLKRVIGGHWGLAPKLQPLVAANEIEAYNFPQGVMSQIFREIAAGKNFLFSKVGLGTFVDPDVDGGKLNEKTVEELVDKVSFENEEYLVYHLPKPQVAILKGTYADENGNISFEEEHLTLEATAMAMAVKNSGGIVIVQVKNKVKSGSLDPKSVKIPGLVVDYVVEVADQSKHMQTFGTQFNSEFLNAGILKAENTGVIKLDQRKVIARRSAQLLPENAKIVNFGIGMPEAISFVLKEENVNDNYTTTIEPGSFGGIPQGGLDFGATIAPEAIIDQNAMFDFYDGGGIDVAFLGLAECDEKGNINVSKFGPKIAGTGGFVNITQNTPVVVFCGTFTAGGLKTSVENGALHITSEGKNIKFVKNVEQITFSAETARKNKQTVYYVTERALFKLVDDGIQLLEIAPGVDLQRDILDEMAFKPIIEKEKLTVMETAIFKEGKIGLK
ncbi:MAG: 3-oxoacid CoA-transferase [Streptococcaceae bacterium]|jgi:propionate CoA-transferase|nr:3-oxoacid CoA-transferase [Streptococcaceae bacterium]